MRNAFLLSLLGLALASTGCLSSSYRLDKGELSKLSQMPPEQRGNRVKVVQNIGASEGPPRADRVGNNTVIIVGSPVWVDDQPHHHNYHEGSATTSTSTGGGNVGGGTSGGSHHGSNGNTSGSTIAGDKKANAKTLLIIAAIAAGALAGTEGARYDGWVKVHPMTPVHLYGPYGGYSVVPLAQIDPQTAAWADHAYIRSEETPFLRLGRAPLNRQGFTYSVLLGAGEVPVSGFNADPGFNGHIQFGYFPTKQIGIQLDLGMGWTQDNLQNTIYISRTALEIEAYLAQAGPIHGGIFGQIGGANRFDDGIQFDDSSSLLGGGGLLQLELTTRLAITGRVGITESFGEAASEVGVGVSIY